jgi:hypothetical protein
MNPAADGIEFASVRIERLLPGPIERVWDYLTQPDLQRTWLAESAADFGGVTRSQPYHSIEFSMRDGSVVSIELEDRGALEPRGENVLLVLTHRPRVPAWLAGAATVLAVALFVFSSSSPGPCARPRQPLGPEIVQTTPGASNHDLKFPSSRLRPLYGMLGGRC